MHAERQEDWRDDWRCTKRKCTTISRTEVQQESVPQWRTLWATRAAATPSLLSRPGWSNFFHADRVGEWQASKGSREREGRNMGHAWRSWKTTPGHRLWSRPPQENWSKSVELLERNRQGLIHVEERSMPSVLDGFCAFSQNLPTRVASLAFVRGCHHEQPTGFLC